jgi:hypothetical protein
LKLLTYQPFSLYSNGGGNRILRRLFKDREADVISLVVEENPLHPRQGTIAETIVYASPIVRKWARWKLRNFRTWLRHGLYKPSTIKKVQAAARKIEYDVLHVIDHGPFLQLYVPMNFARINRFGCPFTIIFLPPTDYGKTAPLYGNAPPAGW